MPTESNNVLQRAAALGYAVVDRVQWLAPLLGRLAVGLLFLSTGWGKVHNIEGIAEWFGNGPDGLHIPAPYFNAVLVSYTELIGGTCLIIGLATRLVSLPLAFSMVIAILTAKLPKLHNVFDLVGFDEFTYLVMFLMIAIIGPGPVSLDAIIAKSAGLRPRDRT